MKTLFSWLCLIGMAATCFAQNAVLRTRWTTNADNAQIDGGNLTNITAMSTNVPSYVVTNNDVNARVLKGGLDSQGAAGVNSTVLGNAATATGLQTTAIGGVASASNTNSLAIGYGAGASAWKAVAVGAGAHAGFSNDVALGAGAWPQSNNVVQLGDNGASYSFFVGSNAYYPTGWFLTLTNQARQSNYITWAAGADLLQLKNSCFSVTEPPSTVYGGRTIFKANQVTFQGSVIGASGFEKVKFSASASSDADDLWAALGTNSAYVGELTEAGQLFVTSLQQPFTYSATNYTMSVIGASAKADHTVFDYCQSGTHTNALPPLAYWSNPLGIFSQNNCTYVLVRPDTNANYQSIWVTSDHAPFNGGSTNFFLPPASVAILTTEGTNVSFNIGYMTTNQPAATFGTMTFRNGVYSWETNFNATNIGGNISVNNLTNAVATTNIAKLSATVSTNTAYPTNFVLTTDGTSNGFKALPQLINGSGSVTVTSNADNSITLTAAAGSPPVFDPAWFMYAAAGTNATPFSNNIITRANNLYAASNSATTTLATNDAKNLTNVNGAKITGGPITNQIATGAATIAGNASLVTNVPLNAINPTNTTTGNILSNSVVAGVATIVLVPSPAGSGSGIAVSIGTNTTTTTNGSVVIVSALPGTNNIQSAGSNTFVVAGDNNQSYGMGSSLIIGGSGSKLSDYNPPVGLDNFVLEGAGNLLDPTDGSLQNNTMFASGIVGGASNSLYGATTNSGILFSFWSQIQAIVQPGTVIGEVIVGGTSNLINDGTLVSQNEAILGGSYNQLTNGSVNAARSGNVLIGGVGNAISGAGSTAGIQNNTILGGGSNVITGASYGSIVAGGIGNNLGSARNSFAVGYSNQLYASNSAIVGGGWNNINAFNNTTGNPNATSCTILNGTSNNITAPSTSIGVSNSAVGGINAFSTNNNSFVWGGDKNNVTSNTADGQAVFRVPGGFVVQGGALTPTSSTASGGVGDYVEPWDVYTYGPGWVWAMAGVGGTSVPVVSGDAPALSTTANPLINPPTNGLPRCLNITNITQAFIGQLGINTQNRYDTNSLTYSWLVGFGGNLVSNVVLLAATENLNINTPQFYAKTNPPTTFGFSYGTINAVNDSHWMAFANDGVNSNRVDTGISPSTTTNAPHFFVIKKNGTNVVYYIDGASVGTNLYNPTGASCGWVLSNYSPDGTKTNFLEFYREFDRMAIQR